MFEEDSTLLRAEPMEILLRRGRLPYVTLGEIQILHALDDEENCMVFFQFVFIQEKQKCS